MTDASIGPAAPAGPGSGREREVSLPAERSFVVQFRAGSGADQNGPWAGRVEHVVSGLASRFEDWAALRTFIMQVLAEGGRETVELP